MPTTRVVIFAEEDGSVPLLEWLDRVPRKGQDKCLARVEQLAEFGHELRRPAADYLRDGIHELRVRLANVQYRILYFFHGRQAVLSHGFIKKGEEVPKGEIELAIDRKWRFEKNPAKYTYSR